MTDYPVNATCPQCGKTGKSVSAVTPKAHLIDSARDGLTSCEGFRFCGTADCPVAYYRPADGLVFTTRSTRFPIFQKEESIDRLVCYCFRHTVRELHDEVRETGVSVIPGHIRENCGKGLDDCARNNPQGACCLGNVARVIREAKGLTPSDFEGCCCEKIPGRSSASGD